MKALVGKSEKELVPQAVFDLAEKLSQFSFVQKVLLFGSRSRGDAQERSDIDLAVACPGASIHQWQEVLTLVEEAHTLLPIDCVRFEQAPVELRESILQCHQVLFERD